MIHKAFSRFSLLYLFVTSLKCLTELSPNCPHNKVNRYLIKQIITQVSRLMISLPLSLLDAYGIIKPWHYKTCIPFSPQSTIKLNLQFHLEQVLYYHQRTNICYHLYICVQLLTSSPSYNIHIVSRPPPIHSVLKQ